MVRKKAWKPIRPVVVDYLRKHPHEIIMVADMVAALGLSREQVQAQMRLLIRDGMNIRVLSQAAAWQFISGPEMVNGSAPVQLDEVPEPVKEEPEENRKIFVQIGVTRAGAPLVQDAEGLIYVARELE